MPRPPRIDFPDALYHVTSRGNGRAVIFHDDADCERFLAQFAHHVRLAGVVLYAYVLMSNRGVGDAPFGPKRPGDRQALQDYVDRRRRHPSPRWRPKRGPRDRRQTSIAASTENEKVESLGLTPISLSP